MEIFLASLSAASLGVILCWIAARIRSNRPESERLPLLALLFSVWLISTATMGPIFFVLRIPGLFDITIDRVLFLALLAATAFAPSFPKGYPAGDMKSEALIALFTLLCTISMIRHGFRSELPEYPNPWFLFLGGYLMPFAAFCFSKIYLSGEKSLSLVFHVMFYFGVYLSIIAFMEFLGFREYIIPSYIADPSYPLHLDRARGPFLNSAFDGSVMNMSFICGIHLLSTKKGLARWAYPVMLSLFVPAVFFTQTRSVYLGFILTIAALLLFYRTNFIKWKVLTPPLLLAGIGLPALFPFLLSENRRSGGILQMMEVSERVVLIKRSILIFLDHPFFGVGSGQFTRASEHYRAAMPLPVGYDESVQHNHLLGMLAELGITGTTVYLLMIVCFFRHLHGLSGKLPDNGFLGNNLLVCIGLIMIVYMSNNLFVEPTYILFFNVVFFAYTGAVDGFYSRSVAAGTGGQDF